MLSHWAERAAETFGVGFDEALLASARVLAAARGRASETPSPQLMRDWASYYLSDSLPRDPDRFFTFPETSPPQTRVLEKRRFREGSFRLYAFPSRYEVRNPAVRELYESFTQNRTAYLAHWQHAGGGRRTLVCCHGWSLGEPRQAQRMFRMSRLYDLGLDVALFVTPFHWRRASSLRERLSPPFPFRNPILGLEGFGQAVHDLASSFHLLRDRGASEIGLAGASLGGYLAALFASLTAMPAVVCLIVPLVSFHGIRLPVPFHPALGGDDGAAERVAELWKIHSPLSRGCRLPPERCLIIAARGDRLCPFEDVQELYERWNRPDHLFLRGGHVWFFPRQARGKAWYAFLARNGFIAQPL
ncbi:MAG: hypothetical protein AB1640_07040 [bacterium]